MKGPSCHEGGITGSGNPEHGVMIIGIAPGANEMALGTPFVGRSGLLMNSMLEARGVNWHRDKTYCTNLLCFPNENPTGDQKMECWPRLREEISACQPKLIILLGQILSDFFYPTHKFGEVRGMVDWNASLNAYVMPTYHPAAVLRGGDVGANYANDIVRDFAKISRFFNQPPTQEEFKFSVIINNTQAQEVLDNLPRDETVILDIETTNKDVESIDPFKDKLLCLALSTREHTWVFPGSVLQGTRFPRDVKYGAHYSTFDMQVMLKAGVDLEIYDDTLLAHYALDERTGHHKLKPLTRQYCYAGFYEEKVDRSALGKSILSDVYEYNARDAANTGKLLNTFTPMMRANGVYDLYRNLLIPAANVFKHMQYIGVPISVKKLLKLGHEWSVLEGEKENALRAWVKENGGDENINFGSPQQLSKFLFSPKAQGGLGLVCPKRTAKGAHSVDREVLELLADEHPFMKRLDDLRHLSHLKNTYIVPVFDEFIKADGYLHPIANLHGTVGGRLTYAEPAINTMPRKDSESLYGPELRKLFAANLDDEPQDYVIIEADYKQAELWMAWVYCQDPQLLADLESGDIHTNTAAYITEMPIERVTKAQRSDAKRTSFGILYGIGPPKLAKQINKPVHEAARYIQRWNQRYPKWGQFRRENFELTRKHGFVQTLTGRKRRYPVLLDNEPERAITNFPLQSTSHDCLLKSIIDMYWPLRNQFGAYIMLDIHDAILIRAKKENAHAVADYVKYNMSQPKFPGLPGIPVEIKIGNSWGEVEEWGTSKKEIVHARS